MAKRKNINDLNILDDLRIIPSTNNTLNSVEPVKAENINNTTDNEHKDIKSTVIENKENKDNTSDTLNEDLNKNANIENNVEKESFNIDEDSFENSNTTIETKEPETNESETIATATEEINLENVSNITNEDNDNQMVTIHVDGELLSISDLVYQEGKTYYAKPEVFHAYPDTKLRLPLKQGEEKNKLKESIRICGVQEDIICKLDDNKNLIVLSGHNRVVNVDELNHEGYDILVPFKVRLNLTPEEERLIVIDTNLLNRQIKDFSPSTLAYLLKIKRDSETQRNKKIIVSDNRTQYESTLMSDNRTQNTIYSTDSLSDNRTQDSNIGLSDNRTQTTIKKRWSDNNEYELGKSQVALYIKLNDLIPEFIRLIDKKERPLSTTVAYEIAFIEPAKQKIVFDFITKYNIKLTSKFAKSLKSNKDKEFSEEFLKTIFDILNAPKETKKTLTFSSLVEKYIPDITDEEAQTILEKALDLYMSKI